MVGSTLVCYKDPDFHGSMVLGYTSMLVAFSFVFIGIRNQREKYNGGAITFGKAFLTGSYIALIASTLYVITWLVIYYNFMSDFMEKYSAHVLKQSADGGATAAELEQQAAQMATYKNLYKSPLGVVLLTYMEVLPLGLIVSLISALILKKKVKKEA